MYVPYNTTIVISFGYNRLSVESKAKGFDARVYVVVRGNSVEYMYIIMNNLIIFDGLVR